jgi:hypothetical protein
MSGGIPLLPLRVCMALYGKGKAISTQAWTGSEGSRRLRLAEFLDNWITKVARLSALPTGPLYPQEIHLVLISVRG